MKIKRKWAMANSKTFKIAPIKELIYRYHSDETKWIDPFSRSNPFKCVRNDYNPEIEADYNLEAMEFFKLFDDCSVGGVFFDPPYSPRQIKECYSGIGLDVLQSDTQASWWSKRKIEVARVLDIGGISISFGWNSVGIGKTRGFKIIEILLVSHGGAKNDTIVTVERKMQHQLRMF